MPMAIVHALGLVPYRAMPSLSQRRRFFSASSKLSYENILTSSPKPGVGLSKPRLPVYYLGPLSLMVVIGQSP